MKNLRLWEKTHIYLHLKDLFPQFVLNKMEMGGDEGGPPFNSLTVGWVHILKVYHNNEPVRGEEKTSRGWIIQVEKAH